MALGRWPGGAWQRSIRLLAWAEAVILTSCGLVLTTAGLLIRPAWALRRYQLERNNLV